MGEAIHGRHGLARWQRRVRSGEFRPARKGKECGPRIGRQGRTLGIGGTGMEWLAEARQAGLGWLELERQAKAGKARVESRA